jgi:hypothetical protein
VEEGEEAVDQLPLSLDFPLGMKTGVCWPYPGPDHSSRSTNFALVVAVRIQWHSGVTWVEHLHRSIRRQIQIQDQGRQLWELVAVRDELQKC